MMIQNEKCQQADNTSSMATFNFSCANDATLAQGQADDPLDVKNLCSRKLMELLTTHYPKPLNPVQKQSVLQELLMRRHYLAELEKFDLHSH